MINLGRLLVLTTCLALNACQQLPAREEPVNPEVAAAAGTSTELDGMMLPVEQGNPGKSAFRLVDDGYEAFALRMQSARLAQRSLDVQTYIWHPDTAGAFLAYALLQAAERGVKVRILVDDMDARQHHYAFAALSAHRNVSVRIFNPFASRSGFLSKLGEGSRRFGELNRRMHNKTWIADNRIALAGGRNLGNEYFNASDEVNFVDLDMAMIGPVVRDVSDSFDRYWNARSSYPVELLSPEDGSAEALERLRGQLDRLVASETSTRYAKALHDDPAIQQLVKGNWPMRWTDQYQFWSDNPRKALLGEEQEQGSEVLANLLREIASVQQSLWIISPYFVPGVQGSERLTSLAAREVDVRVITNSLATNDVIAVHSGYEKYRQGLLEHGVSLWELKPINEQAKSSLFGSSGASLHTKALVMDGEGAFVGSYNLDPRSTALNTEQGIFVRDPVIGSQLQALFVSQSAPRHAWRLKLHDGDLIWTDDDQQLSSEPEAGWTRRFISTILKWLPIERQL